MVYVQDINGKPMMPTTRYGKVRRLLKDKKAVVVNLCPFTIKLTYVTSDYKQEIVLGVDAGTKHVGLSATTKSKELYSSEVILRNDIVDLLSTRRELRRSRRNRLRYRKPRFDNRVKSKRPGWIAPSVKYKIDAHIRVIDNVCSILPISRIVVEVAQFDTQKINNPEISGKEYQEGDQLRFWNVREYVLARDGHKCQYCKGKSKDKILNVHHIESRKHSDGEKCFGSDDWFIVMAILPTGQVSNHYKSKYWDLFDVLERETAFEYDGHTPNEAADRLEQYLNKKKLGM